MAQGAKELSYLSSELHRRERGPTGGLPASRSLLARFSLFPALGWRGAGSTVEPLVIYVARFPRDRSGCCLDAQSLSAALAVGSADGVRLWHPVPFLQCSSVREKPGLSYPRRTRLSPTRWVSLWESKYSISGTAYFRDVLARSRNSAIVISFFTCRCVVRSCRMRSSASEAR